MYLTYAHQELLKTSDGEQLTADKQPLGSSLIKAHGVLNSEAAAVQLLQRVQSSPWKGQQCI